MNTFYKCILINQDCYQITCDYSRSKYIFLSLFKINLNCNSLFSLQTKLINIFNSYYNLLLKKFIYMFSLLHTQTCSRCLYLCTRHRLFKNIKCNTTKCSTKNELFCISHDPTNP